ncbi:Flp pilus assembly complex ATPase component TadA [Candidatus Daviesbacteria bacterium]|nr:Flp pilus assembly complex ATPase component TadA [Candidatus Daviesbacteria bacterium]
MQLDPASAVTKTTTSLDDNKLTQLLVGSEIISQQDIEHAKELSSQKKISLYEAILEKDLITDENLGKIIADNFGVPPVTLTKVSIPVNLLHILPESVAEKQQTLIFGADKNILKVATTNPQNKDFLQMLGKKAGQKIQIYYATPREIKKSLNVYKKEMLLTFDELLKEQINKADKSGVKNDAPIAKIVDTLIEYAYRSAASDIHIEPEEEKVLVRFRIDGVLHDELDLPPTLHEQIVTRIKVLSKLRIDEHLSAQDGKLQAKLEDEDLDVRVSIVPVVGGEKVVLRLLTSHYRQFGLTDLGMNPKDLEKVKKAFEKPFGMILSSGPTGSGKTTTIYAILKILNTRDKNIATVEDPVEYEIEGINQIQVNPKTNLTFAEGLRSILRQDPDIIYVGEIRDEETAGIAINSAMTGHLVLSTLHTNNAATGLPRLIDMKIEPFLVSSTVNAMIGQRLVRKICDRCKYSYTQKLEELVKQYSKEMIEKHLGTEAETRLYKGKGCNVCHMSGYLGRIGIFEVLELSPTIKDMILKKTDADTINAQAIKDGMTTMYEDGLDKVQLGLTTIEEVLRATSE